MHRSLYVVGIFIVILSFQPVTLAYRGSDVAEREYYGHWIQCTENPILYLQVREASSPVSVYLLQSADAEQALEMGSLGNITPEFELENVTSYYGPIEISKPGVYVIFVTTCSKIPSYYDLLIISSVPNMRAFIVALIVLCLGASFHIMKLSREGRITIRSSKANSTND